jgi:hypothetical protein
MSVCFADVAAGLSLRLHRLESLCHKVLKLKADR